MIINMKLIKVLLSFSFLYFLALLQTSFLVHFTVFNMVPNFVLLFIILWNLLEDSKKSFGLFLALIGGFLLDVFSSHAIGFNILIMVSISLIIKVIVKKYVRIPFAEIA